MNKIEILSNSISNNNSLVLTESNNYVINWNKLNVPSLTITLGSNISVNVLEVGNNIEHEIYYVVGENSNLTVTICAINNACDCKYDFDIARDANVNAAYADFAEGKVFGDIKFDLRGVGSSVNWHLASLAAKEDKKEFAVSFNHLASNTTAMMNNYGVCEDNANLTFSGIGYIYKGSKRAKTHQNAKIMVFDPECVAKASPILKIDENDIEASHAATVGKVSDEHLFYLCSRGIGEEEAKRLITLGYLNPIIKYFDDEDVISQIAEAIERRI